MICQPPDSRSGPWVEGASPSSSGYNVGPTLDRTPCHHGATYTHPHSLDLGHADRPVNLTCTSLGLGREPVSGFPGKNSCGLGEELQILQTMAGIRLCLSVVISVMKEQRWKKPQHIEGLLYTEFASLFPGQQGHSGSFWMPKTNKTKKQWIQECSDSDNTSGSWCSLNFPLVSWNRTI